jgi:putative FmdB family regulatory protein
MPFYDYQCPNCGHEFEELRRYEEIPKCPRCGSDVKRKQIYATVSTGLPNGHCS